MQLKLNIGLEHERVIFVANPPFTVENESLVNHIDNVRGKDQKEFPHDTLSCLAETRGAQSSSPAKSVLNFMEEDRRVKEVYAKAGMTLRYGEFELTEEQAKYALEPSGDKKDKEPNFNLIRGSGLHLHFSLMAYDESGLCMPYWGTSELLRRVEFIRMAVSTLDVCMAPWIKGASSYRKPGQWEVKAHGFEYRSPLWTGNVEDLLAIAHTAHEAVWRTVFDLTSLNASMHRSSHSDTAFRGAILSR